MKSKSSTAVAVPCITQTVFVVFLVLKLVGSIDWSWWWVTSPFWLPAVAVIGIALIYFVILLFVNIVKALRR